MRDERDCEAKENMSSWSPAVDALAVVAVVREDTVVGKDVMD